jgi:PAS domain S-box-containing protein
MYEKFFHLSRDLFCVANKKGYFIEVNPSFSRALGYTKEELISKPFMDFVHPYDREATIEAFQGLYNGQDCVEFENRYRHKDGSYRVLSWSAPAPKEGEELYSLARDVTEIRYTQRKVNQIEQALNDHSIIAMTDYRGVITEVNDKFTEISGYSKEELIGKTHKVVNSGAHSKEFFKNMWETISSGKSWSGIIQNRHKMGHYYFVYSILSPFYDNQGQIEGYLSIRVDMTDYVNLKFAYERTYNILNETSSIAKVGGWEMDVKTNELIWTDETFKILEVEKKDGKRPLLPEGLSLFTEDCRSVIEKAIKDCAEQGISYSLELEARSAKGKVFWIYTNGKANYKDGKIISISGTIQDIDLRKKAEIALERERMKTMQNLKLASLGEISAGIAHEINNPLAVISGTIGLLDRFKDNPEKFDKKLLAMSKSAKRIEKIVKNLKKFSRSSETTKKSVGNLSQIIKESLSFMDFKAQKGSVYFKVNLESEAKVLCDEVEIEQVFVNLFSNAIDSVLEVDEKWVKVESYQEEGNILVKIFDSGPGVPEEIINKIFEPFFTTKEVGKGTGLGLSISKGIIEDHDGELLISNKDNLSCFTVKLPLIM